MPSAISTNHRSLAHGVARPKHGDSFVSTGRRCCPQGRKKAHLVRRRAVLNHNLGVAQRKLIPAIRAANAGRSEVDIRTSRWLPNCPALEGRLAHLDWTCFLRRHLRRVTPK